MYESAFHPGSLYEKKFLVTGGAGFIGSHLVEYLLKHGAGKVRVMDNLMTGSKDNIALFRHHPAYEWLEGDIRESEDCRQACRGIDFVLHQAALGSVQRSILDPVTTDSINAGGFLNILWAAKEQQVKRVVYASSSSVYGDHPVLPKVEAQTGRPLSPYAVSKCSNELYAGVFARNYGMEIIGLRYFNVFGPRQNPDGPYAAVVPAFIRDIQSGVAPLIYGDGLNSRDFTFVENAVQANIRALFVEDALALNEVYNVAVGEQYSIRQLFDFICHFLNCRMLPRFETARQGDIQHSLADISKAARLLKYQPAVRLEDGLRILLNR